MIRIQNLTKRYGRTEALRGISLEVQPGELFGFLGPNGAGKTTTMMILSGLLEPTSGKVEVCGFDLLKEPLEVKRRMGYVPDRPFVYEKLTGRELMGLFGDLYGLNPDAVRTGTKHWLARFGLSARADQLIEGYSHGMKQRVILAATLLHDPQVIIADEPTVGLDPQAARMLKDLLRERCAAGNSVLMSTHTLEVAEQTCDRVGIIHQGQMLATGTVDELRAELETDSASLEEIFLTMTGGHADLGAGR